MAGTVVNFNQARQLGQQTQFEEQQHRARRDRDLSEHNRELIQTLRLDFPNLLNKISKLPQREQFNVLTPIVDAMIMWDRYCDLINKHGGE